MGEGHLSLFFSFSLSLFTYNSLKLVTTALVSSSIGKTGCTNTPILRVLISGGNTARKCSIVASMPARTLVYRSLCTAVRMPSLHYERRMAYKYVCLRADISTMVIDDAIDGMCYDGLIQGLSNTLLRMKQDTTPV